MVSYVGLKAEGLGFDAHLTVCYFGEGRSSEKLAVIDKIIEDFTKSNGRIFFVVRDKFAAFGPDNNIPVVTVTPHLKLRALRRSLEVFSVSEFKEWNPHITLKFKDMQTLTIPPYIKLNDLGVY